MLLFGEFVNVLSQASSVEAKWPPSAILWKDRMSSSKRTSSFLPPTHSQISTSNINITTQMRGTAISGLGKVNTFLKSQKIMGQKGKLEIGTDTHTLLYNKIDNCSEPAL